MHENHSEMVNALVKPGGDIIRSLTDNKAHLLHMMMGISGETGELCDIIKKHVMYDKPITDEMLGHIIEEMGDIEFYLEGLRQGLHLRREQIIRNNIIKLNKRYSTGSFSNEQAKERADKK